MRLTSLTGYERLRMETEVANSRTICAYSEFRTGNSRQRTSLIKPISLLLKLIWIR